MNFGVYIFPTTYSIQPAELAREAEARGFQCLMFPEHTHIPSSRVTPWGGGPVLAKEYSHVYDPFVALAAAAAVTRTIRLGTGICLVVERDPIVLAKEVATLDQLSGGRFDFGIGGGWNVEEMNNHGTEYRTRWKLLRERIEAIKAIWSEEEASYAGEFVNFDAIWCWPKPVQSPHPPVIVGGDGARTLNRVVRYGDEWMPLARGDALEGLPGRIATLQNMAAEAHREPIPVSLFMAPVDKPWLDSLHAQGVGRFIFTLASEPRDDVLKRLDELTAFKEGMG